MKVAVASSGDTLESPIDPRFGRCACFVLVDADTMEFSVIPNPGAKLGQGAGIQAAQAVANAGADVVIAASFGPNAHQALDAAEIAVYPASGVTVRDAVEALNRGEIACLSGPTVSSHFGLGQPARSTGVAPRTANDFSPAGGGRGMGGRRGGGRGAGFGGGRGGGR